jgi:uncharacterized protein
MNMKSQLLANLEVQREFALVFDSGDEVMEGIKNFLAQTHVDSAEFRAIGAFSRATLGYFDIDRKEYQHIEIGEQVEVLSMVGNVALDQGQPKVHAHLVVGKRDGTAHGGHLLKAFVRPTLEVVLNELPQHLRRVHDEKSGLALIDLKNTLPAKA